MISTKLSGLIINNEERLAKRWCAEVKKTEYMKNYQHVGDAELIRRNKRFFEKLAEWIEKGGSRSEIGAIFVQIGKERYKEKFPLPEIIYGVFLAKRVLWDVIISEAFLDTTAQVYQALETLTMIYNYFDQGILYITRGYLEEMYSEIGNSKKIPAAELQNYFFPGSFFKIDISLDKARKK